MSSPLSLYLSFLCLWSCLISTPICPSDPCPRPKSHWIKMIYFLIAIVLLFVFAFLVRSCLIITLICPSDPCPRPKSYWIKLIDFQNCLVIVFVFVFVLLSLYLLVRSGHVSALLSFVRETHSPILIKWSKTHQIKVE